MGALLSASGPAKAPVETGKVVQGIDGDPIRARMAGREHKIRLIGVDTLETRHPTKAVEYFGQEASDFTKAKLQDKTVNLLFSPQARRSACEGRQDEARAAWRAQAYLTVR